MRSIFFAVLVAACSIANADKTNHNYRTKLLSDLKPYTNARVFIQEARPMTSEERIDFHTWQSSRNANVNLSKWSKDLLRVKEMGFTSGSVNDDSLRDGQTFQFVKLGAGQRLNFEKPYCSIRFMHGISPLMTDFHGESRWPAVKLIGLDFSVWQQLAVVHMLLQSTDDKEDGVAVDCFSPSPQQVWTVGLLEDIMAKQLNFSESEFLISKNNSEIHIGDLTRMKVKILKAIPKDTGEKYPTLFIQNGEVVSGIPSLKDGSFCSIAGYGDLVPQRQNVKARQSGKIISATGMSAETAMPIDFESNHMMVFLDIQHKNGPLAGLARKFRNDHGRMKISCGLAQNRTSVSIDELNEITKGVLEFSL